MYSDTAYYAQPNRRLAIIYGKWKYIYSNKGKKEELYDLEYDEKENVNLIGSYIYDVDRKLKTPKKELYFYPYWDDVNSILDKMRGERKKIWKKPTFIQKVEGGLFTFAKGLYKKLRLVVRWIKKK